jgi:protein-disulfide isomerase
MKNNILTPLLTILLIVAVFFLGSFWTKVQYLESGSTKTQAVAQQQQQAPAPSGPVKVSIDDDPILGDKNAKVTIIEFSDYECPFCKRHFTDTYPQLVKEYIDKGLVKLVFRDLPLSFHQNAPKEAEAAECARKQGGDSVYFKFHDQIFTKTTSNGTGLALTELPKIASNLGLDSNKFQKCLDSGEMKSEVDKDLSDAGKVGANGTPAFFIGKSTDDGTIEAPLTSGAQPFSVFKTIIDELLK